jgi:AcrR family transcriptional regulator
MPPRPRDEARRARTDVYRQHVFEAAERVFADRGFEAAKLQEISRLAGLSMGTIYAIFPSKTELHRAILEERGRELLGLARQVATPDRPARAALDALIELYVGYFVSHPGFLRMHLRAGTSWALAPPGSAAQVKHWEDVHALQAGIFRRGIAEGVFVDDDPGYLARLFSALDQVLLADWVAGGMKAGREELVDRLRAQVERSFVRTGARSTRRAGGSRFTARAPSPGSSTPTPRRPPRTPARGTPMSPT